MRVDRMVISQPSRATVGGVISGALSRETEASFDLSPFLVDTGLLVARD